MNTSRLSFLLLTSLCTAAIHVQAMDFNVSGFGTAGYALSDKPYRYQRFIDDHGTFTRDSILGVQADLKFTPQLGATVRANWRRRSRMTAAGMQRWPGRSCRGDRPTNG